MRDTRRAAEYLFDEIGGIDDSYIAAAQSAGKAKVRVPFRAGLVAAAAVLIMTVTVVLPTGLRTKDSMDNEIPDAAIGTKPNYDGNYAPTDDEQDNMAEQSAFVLDSVLGASCESLSFDSTPNLFDGEPRLIWETADGQLYGVTLTAAELDNLDRESGRGDKIGDLSLEAEVKVWISYGNGLVISPYLEDTPGNVGYGELFDYLPEIIPSSAVTGRIQTIIALHT